MSDTPDTLHRLHDEIADLKRKLEFKEMVEEQLQRTEEALYRSERRFHFLADAAIDAIFVFKDGTCRDANQEAADMFGFGDPADFLGMSELDIIAPESRDAVEEYIRDTETRKYCEALGLRRDGTTFPLEIKSRETSWADGETVKVNAIRDISARRAVERQLQQSQKMEAIGRLAGGVAHDVNNVLGVILNSANMLELETGLSEESRDDLSNIVEACRRGRDLTRNLLGFARKGRYVRTDISLNRVVEGAAALLSRTMSKDIHTEFDLQPSLRHVEGDPGQLEHALMNIFLNAADAMESGGIIRITSRDISIPSTDEPASLKLAPGAYIRLDVADTGKGMDEATLQRAFEPFFTTKPEGKGTGLGLSMVYGTVVNHRGDVVIHSAPQQGTCVSLYLPSVERRTSTAPVRPPWTHLVADSPAWILLVDDEPMVLRSSSRILERMGYRVLAAANGQEALRLFKKHQGAIDVVLLDMIMPEMDGSRVFSVLRQIDPDVRVAICSGYAKDHKVEKLIAQGACAFIEKPFDPETLARTIRDILRHSRDVDQRREPSGDPRVDET